MRLSKNASELALGRKFKNIPCLYLSLEITHADHSDPAYRPRLRPLDDYSQALDDLIAAETTFLRPLPLQGAGGVSAEEGSMNPYPGGSTQGVSSGGAWPSESAPYRAGYSGAAQEVDSDDTEDELDIPAPHPPKRKSPGVEDVTALHSAVVESIGRVKKTDLWTKLFGTIVVTGAGSKIKVTLACRTSS